MGRPGELRRPVISDGPLKDLNDALHELHLDAGLPSLSTMYRALGKSISRSGLHDALTGISRPQWETVEALVEVLSARSPRTSAEQEVKRFHELWTNAARSVIAPGNVASSDSRTPSTAIVSAFWIIGADVAGFSGATYPMQVSLQQRFYDDVKEALSIAGFSSAAHTMSTGDGLLLLLPAEQADIGPLVGFLLHLQRLMLDQRSAEAPLQVRVAVTQGTATAGENGWYGASLNTAARLLDAAPLRATIGSPAVRLAVAVSEEVHDEVRRLKPRGFRPEFDPAHVVTRHGDIPMWIYTAKIPV